MPSLSAWEACSPALLSKAVFGAFLAYSPRGTSETSRQSKAICHEIKRDGPSGEPRVRMIEYAVGRLQDHATETLRDLIATDVTLVPMPKSAPFPPRQTNALWVPRRICEALRAHGFGRDILPCLERVTAVAKSASAEAGGRPSPRDHLGSMAVKPSVLRPERITLVDDVVTRGATALAGASLVQDAFSEAEVRVFVLVRTMGFLPDLERIVDPVVGTICLQPWGAADRRP